MPRTTQMPAPHEHIAPLNTQDIAAVRQVLVAGLAERWGVYRPELNPDIESFPASFGQSITLVAKQSGKVVGTATLKFINDYQAQIVRMSVIASERRAGIGGTLLKALLELAREHQLREVVLETTSAWDSAVAFYAGHGFHRTHEKDGDSYFSYTLSAA